MPREPDWSSVERDDINGTDPYDDADYIDAITDIGEPDDAEEGEGGYEE